MSELTKKTVAELEIDRGELLIARQRIVAELGALESQLAEFAARCATKLPAPQYHKIQQQRAEVVRLKNEKVAELGSLKSAVQEIQTVIEVRKAQAGGLTSGEVKQLVAIRDEMHEFSMDASNAKSARDAAWKFCQQLRTVLKIHFDRTSGGI